MAELVFFFDHEGDTRKITCVEGDIQSVDDLIPMVEAKYSDVELDTKDVRFWTTDQNFHIRHKLETPKDIYNGAVLEVTFGSNHKRKRKEEEQDVAPKRPRILGPRFIARLKGLPWQTTQKQIRKFFEGIDLVRIQILNKKDGLASGDALVEFQNDDDLELGLGKDKQHIGDRYIEVIKTTGGEMDRALGMVDPNIIKSTDNKVLRMGGLPYSATLDEVHAFFQEGEVTPAKVHIISDIATGFATGKAYVEFESDQEIIAAMGLNRNEIGDRYIELFRSTMGELKRELGLETIARGETRLTGGLGIQDRGGQGDAYIRMKGLPYRTKENDIGNFFKDVGVIPLKIHRKEDGSEAFVEFHSADISKAMSRNKSYIGNRYVDLFRVSYDEVADTVGLRSRSTRRRAYH